MRRVTSALASRARILRGCLTVLALALVPLAPPAIANATPSAASKPVTLKVAEFNIEYGGTHVSFDKVIEAIRRGGADVVGIEEAQGHTARLARALGWPYYSSRLQILSKFPIIDPPGGDSVYVFIEVAPGQVVAIENVHLPSNPYGPFWVKQGYSRADVIAEERKLRLPAVRASLHAAKGLISKGIPVFLTGDFNTPSWRDWTPQMVGVRYQIRYAVKWPVSVAVERAGFVDSYRAVHPSPLRAPGLTWWAARPDLPGWDPGKTAPEDRIDFVYAAGAAEATRSIIVGERGHDGVDVGISPWPSDHRSTVSTFEVTPSPTPVLVAVQRRLLPVGKDVVTIFHTPGVGDEQVAVVPAGGDPATDTIDAQPTGAVVDGSLTFSTETWQAGAYEAVLLDGAGAELSRIAFWLKEPGTGPVISTGMSSYAVGEPIDVTWSNARGERWDWIGVYHRGADPHVAYYLLWAYTGATVEGSLVLDDSANGRFPLRAGKYSVYLLRDDGYVKMAGTDFTITR
jgi:endonuclease/exonuclease/phosphatase family metal-dependent hydrolase